MRVRSRRVYHHGRRAVYLTYQMPYLAAEPIEFYRLGGPAEAPVFRQTVSREFYLYRCASGVAAAASYLRNYQPPALRGSPR